MFIFRKFKFKTRLGACKRLCRDAMAYASTRKSEDYVISTGRAESVRKFAEISANALGWGSSGIPGIYWEGEGLDEVGRRADTNEIVIKVDSRYFRPTEVDFLLGDS